MSPKEPNEQSLMTRLMTRPVSRRTAGRRLPPRPWGNSGAETSTYGEWRTR